MQEIDAGVTGLLFRIVDGNLGRVVSERKEEDCKSLPKKED